MSEPATLPACISDASNYLAVLQSLTQAVEGGIAALAENQLSQFKAQLVRQVDCCSLLKTVRVSESYRRFAGFSVPGCTEGPELGARICAEQARLAQLNRVYRAVLRHLALSVDVLSAHCRTYVCNCDEVGHFSARDDRLITEA